MIEDNIWITDGHTNNCLNRRGGTIVNTRVSIAYLAMGGE